MITIEQLIAEMVRQTATIDAEVEVAQRVAADAGVKDAQSRAPVLTGTLRNSITADEDGFGTDVPYAPFVEFGTAYMAPQPFIGPAADVVEPLFARGVLEAGDF